MKAQPKTLSVTLYVHALKQFNGTYRYQAYTFKADVSLGVGFVVSEHTVEIPYQELPLEQLVNAEIEMLREEQNKILADAQVNSSLLEDQIQMLLCVEGKPISKIDEEIPY